MIKNVSDEQIVSAIRDGARVAHLTDRLGLAGKDRPAVTRRLKLLERYGRVKRDERYSFDNSYYWVRL